MRSWSCDPERRRQWFGRCANRNVQIRCRPKRVMRLRESMYARERWSWLPRQSSPHLENRAWKRRPRCLTLYESCQRPRRLRFVATNYPYLTLCNRGARALCSLSRHVPCLQHRFPRLRRRKVDAGTLEHPRVTLILPAVREICVQPCDVSQSPPRRWQH